MWRFKRTPFTWAFLALAPCVASAKEVVYLTDLPLYSSLAPCAASALSNNIRYQTFSKNCPEAVTDLQSCICTEQFKPVSSTASLMISVTCGSTASEDQSSASTVLKAYCDQDWKVVFPTEKNPVSSFIDEIPAMTDLAPCASARLSGILRDMTDYLCPPEPTALAPCACDKNQNSLRISQSINSVVGQGCSSNKDDVKSAQAMFAAYCGLNSGTTSFPTTSLPPGDMSYYVTNLPQYASLDTCAQLCVDIAAMYQTTSFCPNNGPEALASCLCLKTSVSKTVSSELTWQVRNHCHTNMLENLSSANAVLDYYCSAARGEVTATEIAVSQSQDAGSRTGSGSVASETSSHDDSKDDKSGSPSAGVIAGAVVGSVVGLLAGGACVFFFMRRAAQRKQEGRASEERNGNHGVVRLESVSAGQVDPTVAPPPYEERPSQPISKR